MVARWGYVDNIFCGGLYVGFHGLGEGAIMFKSKSELREEIDETLDRLLENDAALESVRAKDGYESEADALERLQESLMAHLMHLDGLLSGTCDQKQPLLTKTIAKKLRRSGYGNREPVRAKTRRAHREPVNN